MSWLEIVLLWALFASTFLAQIRLPGLPFAANNVLVPVLALALALLARTAIPLVLRAHRTLLQATILVWIWIWVSSFNGVQPTLSLRFAAKYSAFLVVGFSFLLLLERREARRTALRAVYLMLVVLAAAGLVEYWWPFSPFVDLRGHLATFPRVASLFVWPNQFGVLMAIGIAAGAALRHGGQLRAGYFLWSLGPLLTALALSGSRNGWFVFACLLAVLGAVRVLGIRQVGLVAAAFALLVVTLPVSRAQLGLGATLPLSLRFLEGNQDLSRLTTPAQTLTPRLLLWRAALEEIRQHPFTGIGLEVFTYSIGPAITGQNAINTHNLLLNVTTELGVVGLALFAFWLWVVFRSGNPFEWTTSVPLLGIGLGQIFDCFTYDYAFMTFAFFFVASYASGSGDDR